jgi:uncharacterized NAD(P)/FAD-binding protein YdhS
MADADSCGNHRGLAWLISELDRFAGAVPEQAVRRLLAEATIQCSDVAPYVQEQAESYMRRCVVRRENYELLVLTWRPSQGSVAHDHSGSLCGLKVVQGALTEQLFERAADSRVHLTGATRVDSEGILVDPGIVVHALVNDPHSPGVLITVHIYSPPLPEIRRYAVAHGPPSKLFTRPPRPNARTIAIIGGGLTGAMTMANLLRFGNDTEPLHIVLIDRQPAIGEGVAYRTTDPRHLLNVPANRMSVWPDRPEDFVTFARSSDPSIVPGDFLPRRTYGLYVRDRLLSLAKAANEQHSAVVLHDEVSRLWPKAPSGWEIETAKGRTLQADLTIMAVGHRPPDDPMPNRWTGPRHRFVADPWAALVLSQIGPDEPVLIIGSGLTAVDVILTLSRFERRAPIIAISRRGLMPMPHLKESKPPCDLPECAAGWLNPALPLNVRTIVSKLRHHIETMHDRGVEWQRVIDALRPIIPRLWERLSVVERSRFFRHVRPFWEVHRHRMAPAVAEVIDHLRRNQTLQVRTGALVFAAADSSGIDITLVPTGSDRKETMRVAWVVNCTGPGVHSHHTTHPFLRPLLQRGVLVTDELCLGLITDGFGRAVNANGRTLPDLFVAGTLRKATLWESTAVPELVQQAHTVAHAALAALPHVGSGLASRFGSVPAGQSARVAGD